MDKAIFDRFYDKFEVSMRPGRGGSYAYVTANDVTDRMNRLFQGNWCTEVVAQDIDPTGAVIIRVKVSVLDPNSNTWFYHEGFGGQKDASGEPGNAFKSAYSKALVNACRRWGVGLYLDDEAPGLSDAGSPGPAPQKSVPRPTQTPMTAISTQGLPPAPKPAGPPVVGGPPVVEQIAIQQTAPPVVQPTAPPVPITQEPFMPQRSMPKVPEPMQHGAPLNGSRPSTQPIAQPAPSATGPEVVNVDAISDVQKIAIQSLYDMRGYKYADLAQAILGNVPDINTLSHDQAVSIIQYGNELYKKSKTN